MEHSIFDESSSFLVTESLGQHIITLTKMPVTKFPAELPIADHFSHCPLQLVYCSHSGGPTELFSNCSGFGFESGSSSRMKVLWPDYLHRIAPTTQQYSKDSLHTFLGTAASISHFSLPHLVFSFSSPSLLRTIHPINFACPDLTMAYFTLVNKAFAFVLLAAITAAEPHCLHKDDWKSLQGRTSERDINVSGQNRTYLLHIPQDFSKIKGKVGIVFSYHEEMKDAYYQERISGFSDPALKKNYVAVYPQAMDGIWYPGRSSGGNYSDSLTTNPQDHIFTSAILEELYAARGLCLDSTQAYATGMGNGSSFVHHLNCRNVHDPPFQAFAGVAGIPHTLDMSPDRCFHAGSKPLLMLHGINDREHTKLKVSALTLVRNSLRDQDLHVADLLRNNIANPQRT